MENTKSLRSYKLWHVLTAFAVGAVVVVGVFLAPGVGLQGLTRYSSVPINSGVKTSAPTSACLTKADLQQFQSVEGMHYQNLIYMLHPYTGDLGKRLNNVQNIEGMHYTSLIQLLHPYTGSLGKRIDQSVNYLLTNLN